MTYHVEFSAATKRPITEDESAALVEDLHAYGAAVHSTPDGFTIFGNDEPSRVDFVGACLRACKRLALPVAGVPLVKVVDAA